MSSVIKKQVVTRFPGRETDGMKKEGDMTMNLRDCYIGFGGDYDEALGRLCGNTPGRRKVNGQK